MKVEGKAKLFNLSSIQLRDSLMLSFLKRTGGQSTSADEMLGNQGVTESNMMQYLGQLSNLFSILKTKKVKQYA